MPENRGMYFFMLVKILVENRFYPLAIGNH